MRPSHVDQLAPQLAEILGTSAEIDRGALLNHIGLIDAVIRAANRRFVVDYRGSAGLAGLQEAAQRSRHVAGLLNATPLVAVPFMNKAGAEACRALGVSWFDLAGNATIHADELLVRIEGRQPAKARGRPASAFSPRSARIARALLDRPQKRFSQRDLTTITGLSEGYVSKVVRRLHDDRLIVRDDKGMLFVEQPDVLLDAWAQDYAFDKHTIVAGHIAVRRDPELITVIGDGLRAAGHVHAFTALPAAWLMSHHADFRMASVYVDAIPDEDVLAKLRFRAEPRGANAWLVVPNDVDILQSRRIVEQHPCVTAAQVWLDLRANPERAAEAAAELRLRHMPWTAS